MTNGRPWRLSSDEAIAAIDAGIRFFVELGDGTRVDVVVARGRFRRYLRTKADAHTANNLLRLPDC